MENSRQMTVCDASTTFQCFLPSGSKGCASAGSGAWRRSPRYMPAQTRAHSFVRCAHAAHLAFCLHSTFGQPRNLNFLYRNFSVTFLSAKMPKNILAEMGSQVGLTPARQHKKVSFASQTTFDENAQSDIFCEFMRSFSSATEGARWRIFSDSTAYSEPNEWLDVVHGQAKNK